MVFFWLQLQASTDQELNQEIPHFNLPSKILCRVVKVQLLAEQETDEVYAYLALLPESDICDAVAVAGLLNATLVIPIFHLNSVWRDSRIKKLATGDSAASCPFHGGLFFPQLDTEYYFYAQSGNVCRRAEHWNVPKSALFKQILRPGKGFGLRDYVTRWLNPVSLNLQRFCGNANVSLYTPKPV
ncbi:auxin response factor 2A-like isoform X1 [Trifolium pratense]|uniref:auxin response factor 2A-like isoform X1 n=1 Tax=Trifolium pratense TaxID=57577 RepID=UPI001E698337|nr:auxin response factor 2A-like isoform X1 [Trifolium pratense]XP_045823680.1 auxin response factor 2A-like isoform X1 [Trifolium pratense]